MALAATKSYHIGELLTDTIKTYEFNDTISINDFIIKTDETLVEKPSIVVLNGKSQLNVNSISNYGNDITINGYVFSGGTPPTGPIDQQDISVENINAYKGVNPGNDKVNMIDKLILNDNLRFIGLGDDNDVDYNQSILIEREFDTDKWELLLFKGNKQNNRLRFDTEDEIVFQTDNSSERLYDNITEGTTRMVINNTDISIHTLPLKVDTITGLTPGINIENISFEAGNIDNITDISMSGDLYTDNILEKTFNAGITIDKLITDDIFVNTMSEVTISGVLIKDGVITPDEIITDIFTVNTINGNDGIYIENILIKDRHISNVSGISTNSINTTNINPFNISTGVTIDNTLFKNGDITNSTGKLTMSTIDLDGSMQTDFIYEKTSDNGVNIDGVICKDGNITVDGIIYDKEIVDADKIICMDIQGMNIKASCLVATLGNITLSGEQIIDGTVLQTGDRILVKNQTNQSENGIYIISDDPWIRSVDCNESVDFTGARLTILKGTINKHKFYLQTTNDVNVDTDNVIFIDLHSLGTISHSALSDLSSDDHTQYALLDGRNTDTMKIDDIVEFTGSNGTNINNMNISDNGSNVIIAVPSGRTIQLKIGSTVVAEYII